MKKVVVFVLCLIVGCSQENESSSPRSSARIVTDSLLEISENKPLVAPPVTLVDPIQDLKYRHFVRGKRFSFANGTDIYDRESGQIWFDEVDGQVMVYDIVKVDGVFEHQQGFGKYYYDSNFSEITVTFTDSGNKAIIGSTRRFGCRWSDPNIFVIKNDTDPSKLYLVDLDRGFTYRQSN